MNIKIELLKNYLIDVIINKIDVLEIDADNIANTSAIRILSEIEEIIKNEKIDDFEAIEKIVCVFEKNNIDCGFRHDC